MASRHAHPGRPTRRKPRQPGLAGLDHRPDRMPSGHGASRVTSAQPLILRRTTGYQRAFLTEYEPGGAACPPRCAASCATRAPWTTRCARAGTHGRGAHTASRRRYRRQFVPAALRGRQQAHLPRARQPALLRENLCPLTFLGSSSAHDGALAADRDAGGHARAHHPPLQAAAVRVESPGRGSARAGTMTGLP